MGVGGGENWCPLFCSSEAFWASTYLVKLLVAQITYHYCDDLFRERTFGAGVEGVEGYQNIVA